MDDERYIEVLGNLELVLEVGTACSARLVGTMPTSMQHSHADPIFTKILAHSTSLHALSPQLATGKPVRQLWDMPSACALARCVIEANDVLEYIALSELPAPQAEFRLLVWNLHDQQRRNKMLRLLKSRDPRADDIAKQAVALAAEVERHPCFADLPKPQQQKIRTGDAPAFLSSQRERNAARGVNHDYYTGAVMLLS